MPEIDDDLTENERLARDTTEVVLSESSQLFVDELVDACLKFCNQLSGHPLRNYQAPFARRVFESLIIEDAEVITALFSRQSGKSETIANCVAACMIMFPILAKAYPDSEMAKWKEGFWVGAFAPVDDQADTLHGRICQRLSSERAAVLMADPDIDVKITKKGRTFELSNGSLVKKTTCHPRATIEGRTYHLIIIDECQGADDGMVDNSILPMGAETAATTVYTGTPGYTKNVFYREIQANKRMGTTRGRKRCNHFQVDWKTVGKESPRYLKYALKKMRKLGEDSDEFRRQFCNQWLLEKGMFILESRLAELEDHSMQKLVTDWHKTPVIIGIDCAEKVDRTVLTAVFVDWDHPNEAGLYVHRVLNWMDLEGLDWEAQYFKMMEFIRRYNVWKVGVDTNGMGGPVINRLRHLMPDIDFVDLGSSPTEQSVRWQHLRNLLHQRMIYWPGGAKVRELKCWKRFYTEMADLEIEFKGPNMLAAAPNEHDAHDDYPDSLSMACVLSIHEDDEPAEVTQNFLYRRSSRR